MDINTASVDELTAIKGIGKASSEKFVKIRPYARKDELVSKKVVPQATYDKVKDQIIAKQPKETASKGTDAKRTVSKAAEPLTTKKIAPPSPGNLNPVGK